MDDNTVQLDEKDTAFAKAVATVSGCRNIEQLEGARQYIRQYIEKYGEGPECAALWALVKDMDLRLFPPEAGPLPDEGG